jgi:hypothetical protein
MRTTLEIPDPLFKHLKARAAMEGLTLRDLVVTLVERGLHAPANSPTTPASLPSIALGAPVALKPAALSNSTLANMLDE